MANSGNGSGQGGGGSVIWLIIKAVLIMVAAYMIFGIVLSLVKYAFIVALLGGLGYLGYKLLAGNATGSRTLPAPESQYLLDTEAQPANAFERRLKALEAEDQRLNEEIDRLMSE